MRVVITKCQLPVPLGSQRRLEAQPLQTAAAEVLRTMSLQPRTERGLQALPLKVSQGEQEQF